MRCDIDMELLLAEAERLIRIDPTAQQVILVQTSKSQLYHLLNHGIDSGDTTEEEHFVEMLREKGDTEIRYLVCMWKDSVIDLPSAHFRRRLIELSPQNAAALVFLRGEGTFIAKELEKTMPKSGR